MIGNKIKNIRELKNFTQEYMAEKLDISQAAYSKLEKGDIKVSTEKLSQIAKILNVNPKDIISFDLDKYFSSFNTTKESNSSSTIVDTNEAHLITQLYEDKIFLLEKLLRNTEKELENYKKKYGPL